MSMELMMESRPKVNSGKENDQTRVNLSNLEQMMTGSMIGGS